MKIKDTPANILAAVAAVYPDIDLTLAEVRSNVPTLKREIAKYQAAALYKLARQYNRANARILEIGTAWGYSAAVMSSAAPLAEIVTLNPDPKEAEIAVRNLDRYPNVHVEIVKSWDFLNASPGAFDMIFCDGDHKRVWLDLPGWNFLNVGGLFLFHDYAPAGATEGKDGKLRECPPVFEAVNAFAFGLGREPDVLIVDDGGVGMAGWYRHENDPDVNEVSMGKVTFMKRTKPYAPPTLAPAIWQIGQATSYSILDYSHLQALFELGQRVQDIEGAIVEAGCGNGGSAAVLYIGARRKTKPIKRDLWVYDSFAGMPPAGDKDSDKAKSKAQRPGGWCMADVAKVEEIMNMEGFKVPKKSLMIGAGEFAESFAAFQTGPIALLHIDATLYRSTKLALDTFYERVLHGGIITVSAFTHWSGVKAAVTEFLSEHGLKPVLLPVDRSNIYWVK